MITVLHEQRETALPDARVQARADGAALWLDRDAIEQATGWAWKPEGLCRDDACVPLPRDPSLVDGNRLDVAGLWRRLGHPVVHDTTAKQWVLGTGKQQRSDALASLQAPDFALPDLDGTLHRLSDWRGHKVFLASWASW